jgi:membrane protein DedA with SNARE-associated domain
MRKVFGYFFYGLAALLYVLGVLVVGRELGWSMAGLVATISDPELLANTLAMAVGALIPAFIAHFVAHRLMNSRADTPEAERHRNDRQ